MQLHVKAAALMAATFVSGCGFVPKNPPKPQEGQRIPINLAAPNPRPWALPITPPPSVAALPPTPATTVAASTPEGLTPAITTITTPTASASTSASQDQPLSQPLVSAKEVAPQPTVVTQEPIAMWPVLLAFDTTSQLQGPRTELPDNRVSFSWPEPIKPVQVQAEPSASTNGSDPSSSASLPLNEVTPADQTALAEIANDTVKTVEVQTPTDVKSDQPPAPQSEPEPPTEPNRTWAAQAGMTLSELLSTWGAEQEWIVRWTSDSDFRIEAPFSIEAPDFIAAASQVFKAYRDAGRTFNVMAYTNRVMVVTVPTD